MFKLHDEIALAKRRLPLPDLLSRLDLAEHAKKSSRCPFHDDRSPSFSVWLGTAGWQWKCMTGCGNGDEISFLETLFGTSRVEAIQRYLALAENGSTEPAPMRSAARLKKPTAPTLPSDASPGTEADWRAVAALRGLSWHASAKAVELGTLHFGTVCGFACWIITDERRLCAEARRMDGEKFPAVGQLGERKAHTIRGSVKSWPVGVSIRRFSPSDFRSLLVVEGGPDYLAALHFTMADKCDCLPIAFLGAGSGSAIHPEALPLLRNVRARFYPHHEGNGAGMAAVRKWSAQFDSIGARVDAFDFGGLRKADGTPVKDLNDCALIHADDVAQLEGLLP